jgi:hypothetical protein
MREAVAATNIERTTRAMAISKSVTLDHLSAELGRLSAKIGVQQEALASGSAADKVQAAGDLVELQQRAANIRVRLQRLAEGQAGADNDVKTGIELEVRDLADTFERWLDR